MYEAEQALVLGQIQARIRHGLIKQIEDSMPDIRFCIETGRRNTAISLCDQAIAPYQSNIPLVDRHIETVRHWASL